MATVVLDAGKSLTKLSLWDADGTLVERRVRGNPRLRAGSYAALDTHGIEEWMASVLREFVHEAPVDSIIPVGHGAAAAIVRGGVLACPPMDYEAPILADERAAYDAQRDGFLATGSPALPGGLNLGAQLHYLERRDPQLFSGGAMLLPWPQYWAWLLSGVAACEVTSLGCHSDLWLPFENRPSALAQTRGWAQALPPMRRAGDVLGRIRPAWVQRTGLSPDVRIHCGLHDSNAALLGARAFTEIGAGESTVLSTGTWFVAMRSTAAAVDPGKLDEARDCLINVDADGRPVPSARFMGGREIETLIGDSARVDTEGDPEAQLALVPKLLKAGAMALPSFTPGCGPFGACVGRWVGQPADPREARVAASLYAALVTDAALGLIGTRERLLIEGRFARSPVFCRALASLRRDLNIYTCSAESDVSYGALRLVHPELGPPGRLTEVAPLQFDLLTYRRQWLDRVATMQAAA